MGTSRKNCCVLLSFYLLMLGGLGIYMLRVLSDFDNQAILNDNPGFNNYCQRKGLSKFDLSVCFGSKHVEPSLESSQKDDTKHKKLFMLFSDGTPYAFYKSMVSDPKWEGALVSIPSRSLGPKASGPIFRGASLGRVDGNYRSDMSKIDNIFGQIYKVAGIQFSLFTNYQFPILDNIKTESFASVPLVPEIEDEAFNSFCKIQKGQGYIYYDHKGDGGCSGIWDCSYSSMEEAAAGAQGLYKEKLATLKKGDTSELQQCLDKEVGQSGGLLMYSADTDNIAHTYTVLSKKVVEAHATIRANFEFTAEYLLHKHPDCLIAIFSDHGHCENIVMAELADHGFEEGDNRGFLMLLSNKFKEKSLRKGTPIEDHIKLFSHFSVLMEGVNLPAFTERIPPLLFEGDQIEKLRVFRLKEMQLDFLLGYKSRFSQQHIGGFLQERKVNTSLTAAQLVEVLGPQSTTDLLQAYEAKLRSLMSRSYVHKLAELLGNWYSSTVATYTALLMTVVIIFLAWKQQTKMIPVESRRGQLLAVSVLAAWYLLHMVSSKLNKWDMVVAPVFLALVGLGLLLPKSTGLPDNPNRESCATPAFLDEKSLAFLRNTCLGMATATALVRVSFSYVLHRVHLVKVWLYALAPVGTLVGMSLVTFWTLYLVWFAWKTEEDDPVVDQSLNKSFDSRNEDSESNPPHKVASIQIKRKLIKCFRMLQASLVITMLAIAILYEFKLHRQQNMNHESDGVLMVQILYWCIGLSLVFSLFGQPEYSRVILIPMFYINMSNLQNHWTRTCYGCLFMPVLAWTLSKYRELKADADDSIRRAREALLFAILLIAQYGYYRANKEQYVYHINQRAFWRMPVSNPDKAGLILLLHILNVKSCSALFLLQLIHSVSRQKTLIEMNFLMLFHVCFLMIECFFQIKQGVKWVSFVIMAIIHILLPVFFQALAWLRELVQYLLRAAFKKNSTKAAGKPSEQQSHQIEMAHSTVCPDDSLADL